MEGKTLAEWESKKKIMNSDEIQTHPAKSQLTLEEPASYDEDTEPAEKVDKTEIGTDQDPELDSDEEQIVEPVAKCQRRRYLLRERRAPRRFPDAEHVLLTDEGEPKASKKQRTTPTVENG